MHNKKQMLLETIVIFLIFAISAVILGLVSAMYVNTQTNTLGGGGGYKPSSTSMNSASGSDNQTSLIDSPLNNDDIPVNTLETTTMWLITIDHPNGCVETDIVSVQIFAADGSEISSRGLTTTDNNNKWEWEVNVPSSVTVKQVHVTKSLDLYKGGSSCTILSNGTVVKVQTLDTYTSTQTIYV